MSTKRFFVNSPTPANAARHALESYTVTQVPEHPATVAISWTCTCGTWEARRPGTEAAITWAAHCHRWPDPHPFTGGVPADDARLLTGAPHETR